MKAEEWVVICAEPLRCWLVGNSKVEHSANRGTVYGSAFDPETDQTSSEDIHNHHDPVAAEEDGFAAEQVSAPKTVLCVRDQGLPSGSGCSGRWQVPEIESMTTFSVELRKRVTASPYASQPGLLLTR